MRSPARPSGLISLALALALPGLSFAQSETPRAFASRVVGQASASVMSRDTLGDGAVAGRGAERSPAPAKGAAVGVVPCALMLSASSNSDASASRS